MFTAVHTFRIALNWQLVGLISQIDRFDASWKSIEKREGQSLKQLKSIATVRSVGASTRIEGSKLSDQNIDLLLKNLDINKLEDRDSQEAVGYFDVMDLISESYNDIKISENELKNLHNILLKYGDKDEWHKGDYKKQSNSVEATLANGQKQIIFSTTPPGFATDDAMRSLIDWYHSDDITHPLVKCALFSYEFVSIHPFQDGNGRMSRLLSSLLLLKYGYNWIEYISLEHEIENRKTEYYRKLRKCQSQRPHEDVTSWVIFFFDALINIQGQLMKKLLVQGANAQLSAREKTLLIFIGAHPGAKSGDISKELEISAITVKRTLNELLSKNLIEKAGAGAGVNYILK